MTGIEKIKDRILADAEIYAKDQIHTAAEKAEKILEAARVVAEEKRSIIMQEAEREAADTGRRMIAFADMEIKKEFLTVKREVVNKAFEKAMEKLCNMETEKYCSFLAHMIAAAAGKEKSEIILSHKDRISFGETLISMAALEAKSMEKQVDLSLSGVTYDIRGGFILKIGDVELNYSFEALLRAHREELEELAYSMLNIR